MIVDAYVWLYADMDMGYQGGAHQVCERELTWMVIDRHRWVWI